LEVSDLVLENSEVLNDSERRNFINHYKVTSQIVIGILDEALELPNAITSDPDARRGMIDAEYTPPRSNQASWLRRRYFLNGGALKSRIRFARIAPESFWISPYYAVKREGNP